MAKQRKGKKRSSTPRPLKEAERFGEPANANADRAGVGSFLFQACYVALLCVIVANYFGKVESLTSGHLKKRMASIFSSFECTSNVYLLAQFGQLDESCKCYRTPNDWRAILEP